MAKEITEEKNPLLINTEACQKLFKNSVGRPKKCKEISFSPEPKSIIAVLLNKEKKNLNKSDKKESCEFTKKQKTWTCEYCSKRAFHNKFDFKKHITKHTKIFKCDFENCTYNTKFSSNLKSHKRVHLSDGPYYCDECTFRTKFISSLKTHKRLHSAERTYNCQYCEHNCDSCSNLKKQCAYIHQNEIKVKVNNFPESSDSVQ